MSWTLPTAVIEIKPALLLQIINRRRWMLPIYLRNHIPPCGGFRVNAEQRPQPVMTIVEKELVNAIAAELLDAMDPKNNVIAA